MVTCQYPLLEHVPALTSHSRLTSEQGARNACTRHFSITSSRKRSRRGLASIAPCLRWASRALVSAAAPAQAVQAPGNDVVAWNNGWSWTYATVFNLRRRQRHDRDHQRERDVPGAGPGDVRRAGRLQALADRNDHRRQRAGEDRPRRRPARTTRLLTPSAATVNGERYVRVSDLALLQEHQTQEPQGQGTRELHHH